MLVRPFLFLEGRAEEAIEFYKKAIGAEIGMLMRRKDAPIKSMFMPDNENKVMHSSIKLGDGRIMISNGRNSGKTNFDNVALSLDAKEEAQAHKMFKALNEGGSITMPLGKTFFSPCFGMVRDKFGMHWMITVES